MKKILHIIDSLAVGGAEKLLVGIINELEGFEQHLILLHGPDTLKEKIDRDLRFTNLDVKAGWKGLWPASRKVRKYIKEHKIDIVHSHLYEANVVARLATPASVNLYNTIHAISSLASYKVNRLALYLEKLTYKKRHHIVSVSEEVEKDFDQWVGLKGYSTILYNYVEEKFFAPNAKSTFSEDQLRLVAVGNLRYQKNYPYLIEAFKLLPASVSLDVYGEGGMRAELQKEIEDHQLKIRLCGLRDDLHEKLRTYDAFVMSSFYEGQPVSLLEAMAAGLPPIIADLPVLKEVTGEAAVYFTIDEPASFARAIRQVLEKKRDLRTIAAKAHQRANEFAHKYQYMQQLENLYAKM